mgnify:CR=1 FL=1
MSNILDTTEAYYTTLGLSQPVELTSFGERHYRVTLTAHYTGEGRLLIGYTPTANEAGLGLTVNASPPRACWPFWVYMLRSAVF